ncbi:TetR/AcrR family transcriptional regulator [Nocardia sp. NBC_01503]|uniref:TetR/AcrR family transcriptional regulator n=1 Tax=Nocardia sp. NBC_01503 TaxID=2975997 RepID=UPI002E7B4B16|nr:TetR/AcrR family transcriptional regulator [Nocardia sp. NBC_01503]WTL29735.1 TetR/AcrR family transcriptional regulator [Nocardia sp. NBC_01503]
MTRRRLPPDERRSQLIDTAAQLFATHDYPAVHMEDVAAAAGVSRALLYRHFPGKPELFAAVYRQAAEQLLVDTHFDPEQPFADQIAAGLDVHFDYFEANAKTVVVANRLLSADPTIQGIITGELSALRERVLDTLGLEGRQRQLFSTVLMSWLTFVRVLVVDWLENPACPRPVLREVCVGALTGALAPLQSATAG